jgi:GT2 family glycosyltransferase
MEAEVFVVDNNSVDGSMEMVEEKFPEVISIINKDNVGFSKANNQAIKISKGEYTLLLNPDTLVEDDTFKKVVSFMDSHPDAGGLGVKMIDGKGKFLPESKRGLPTPAVAFYKISGLAKIFPKSKTFGGYHLGYLDKEQTHEVEILSGAFMLMRKSVLDKIGYLDETFFMYGEDIDLSYRIIKAGYKNYYYPETRIIHYKGESTKKSSVNYVVVFYNAMIIFAKKHFSSKNAGLLSFLINMAVYFRAFLALLSRFFSNAFLPLADIILLAGGIVVIKNYWEHNVIFQEGGAYPTELVSIALPVYVFVWIFSVFLSGAYDKPIKLPKIFQGLFIGTIVILTAYALLPESYRFSRAIIVLGAAWGVVSMMGIRILLHLLNFNKFKLGNATNKRYAIVGNKKETERVAGLMRDAGMNPGFIGLVAINKENIKSQGFIGEIQDIKNIIEIFNIEEVIFCAKDISSQEIIDYMALLGPLNLELKIAPPESLSIIGSQSINTSGDIYILEMDSITKQNNRRNKRLIDILFSFLFLLSTPFLIFFAKRPSGMLVNLLKVLSGKKSMVGYRYTNYSKDHTLPVIKYGILYPTDVLRNQDISEQTIDRLNLLYARDYKVMNDINIIRKGFRQLGRKA